MQRHQGKNYANLRNRPVAQQVTQKIENANPNTQIRAHSPSDSQVAQTPRTASCEDHASAAMFLQPLLLGTLWLKLEVVLKKVTTSVISSFLKVFLDTHNPMADCEFFILIRILA